MCGGSGRRLRWRVRVAVAWLRSTFVPVVHIRIVRKRTNVPL